MNAVAPIVAERDRRRLISALSLLASDKDGEVVAAARAACRLLSPYGVTPAELIGIALDPPAKPKPDPFAGFPSGGALRSHEALARMCLVRGAEVLNSWEMGFLESIIRERSLNSLRETAANTYTPPKGGNGAATRAAAPSYPPGTPTPESRATPRPSRLDRRKASR